MMNKGGSAVMSVHNRNEEFANFAQGIQAVMTMQILASMYTHDFLMSVGISSKSFMSAVFNTLSNGSVNLPILCEIQALVVAETIAQNPAASGLVRGLAPIELVCVELRPIKEGFDIEGFLMLRAAVMAERERELVIVCDPQHYPSVLAWFRNGQQDKTDFVGSLHHLAENALQRYFQASLASELD